MKRGSHFLVKNARKCLCGEKRIVCYKGSLYYRCACYSCGISSPRKTALSDAIIAWNKGRLPLFHDDSVEGILKKVINSFSGSSSVL